MTEQTRKILIICVTIVALVFICIWWMKGRYEYSICESQPGVTVKTVVRFDKNTGKMHISKITPSSTVRFNVWSPIFNTMDELKIWENAQEKSKE